MHFSRHTGPSVIFLWTDTIIELVSTGLISFHPQIWYCSSCFWLYFNSVCTIRLFSMLQLDYSIISLNNSQHHSQAHSSMQCQTQVVPHQLLIRRIALHLHISTQRWLILQMVMWIRKYSWSGSLQLHMMRSTIRFMPKIFLTWVWLIDLQSNSLDNQG